MASEENGKFKYYAFISYKREDEKWAKWLQNRLMHYKLPTNIRKVNPDLPVNVHPVFRDSTDLSGGVLAEVINEALDDSRYLIVICSPRAAQSPWVCKEVEHFIETGREKYIIPFIIEGIPNSNADVTECFPQSLRELAGSRELLGININEMGRDAAAIKVVARMFKLQFDLLWQRWERDRRRRRLILILSLILFTILAISVGVIFAHKNRELSVYNQQMQINQARFVSEKAMQLIEQGNSNLAQKILLEIIYDECKSESYPYTVEAEMAMRRAISNNSCTIDLPFSDVSLVRYSSDGKYIAISSGYNNVYIWDVNKYKFSDCITCNNSSRIVDFYFENNNTNVVVLFEDACFGVWLNGRNMCVNYARFPYFIQKVQSICGVNIDERLVIYDKQGLWHFIPDLLSKYQAIPSGYEFKKFSSTGKYVALVNKSTNQVKLMCNINSNIEKIFSPLVDEINQIVFSQDDKYIAIIGFNKIIIYDIDSEEYLLLDHFKNEYCSGGVFKNNIFITCSESYSNYKTYIRSWEINNDSNLDIYDTNILYELSQPVKDVFFSQSGNEVGLIVNNNKLISLDINNEESLSIAAGKSIISISHNDKRLIMKSKKGYEIWDLDSKKCLKTFNGYVQISPDYKYIVNQKRHSFELWSVETCERVNTYDGSSIFTGEMFSSSSNRLICKMNSGDKTMLKVIDLISNEIFIVDDQINYLNDVKFSPSEECVLYNGWYSYDHYFVKIWDYATKKIYTIYESDDYIDDIQFSPDGKYFAMRASGQNIMIYETATRRQVGIIEIDIDSYYKFLYNGEYGVVKRKFIDRVADNVYFCNVVSGQWMNTDEYYRVDSDEILSSPTGKYWALVDDNELHLWDTEQHKKIRTFNKHTDLITIIKFSNNEEYILSASWDNSLRVWDIKNNTCVATLIGHKDDIHYANFSSDGKYVISSSYDNMIKIWDVESENCIQTISVESSNDIMFSPCGRYIYTSDENNSKLWEFKSLQKLVDEAKDKIKHIPLTIEERQKYYIDMNNIK